MNRDAAEDVRKRIASFQEKISQRFQAALQEGLVTPRDISKIMADMQMSADAVLRSLQSTTLDSEFQEEWLRRIVESYEDRVLKQITEIENRRYTSKALDQRVRTIKGRILQEFKPETLKAQPAKIKVEFETELKRIDKQLWDDIEGVSKNHSKRASIIEASLSEYESELTRLARLIRPRITEDDN
ncbi:hypothetical protein EYB53_022090 [Candidatus Chloroploca sp. M-50]|uniref:Uncharacterized protein n=1 Tax=Candidatus Chloroploca mongolica TaxID=2528176 RepID=A0ABS4DGC0_9CHLR|nr:hypothetical protein [Candidatus Chloroploca mongolica]MBP1468419.1 hypothetical protein [Candidatus Chloroploca mongolica]